MKKAFIILGLLILYGCIAINKNNTISNYQENQLSFFHLRFGYDKNNNWIKDPKNILMLHATFKLIGYKKILTDETWNTNDHWYVDISKSPKNLLDSLESTFSNYTKSPRYYREFWQRRKKEGNDEVVFLVVKEINKIMNENLKLSSRHELINDTLRQLISFEYPERALTEKESNYLLDYLIEIGLHQSAYNVFSGETQSFNNVQWYRNKEEYLQLLEVSESFQTPWFQDDTN